jgi:hypothetical protein
MVDDGKKDEGLRRRDMKGHKTKLDKEFGSLTRNSIRSKTEIRK